LPASAPTRQPKSRSSLSAEAAIVEASKKALDSAGIEIPFPHLQLFVDEVRPKAIEQVAQLRALPSTEADAE
jgi:small-conductance mechanosensitive channel